VPLSHFEPEVHEQFLTVARASWEASVVSFLPSIADPANQTRNRQSQCLKSWRTIMISNGPKWRLRMTVCAGRLALFFISLLLTARQFCGWGIRSVFVFSLYHISLRKYTSSLPASGRSGFRYHERHLSACMVGIRLPAVQLSYLPGRSVGLLSALWSGEVVA